jgi:hypothetical protein
VVTSGTIRTSSRHARVLLLGFFMYILLALVSPAARRSETSIL